MRVRQILANIGTVGFAAFAVVAYVRGGTASGSASTPPLKPTVVPHAERLFAGAHWLGDSTARYRIVEFGDYQCPACRAFDATVRAYQAAHPGMLAVAFRNFPLSYHPRAQAAAIAAHCAAGQGRFEAVHHLLYDLQDSLSLLSWNMVAARAGVADTGAFARCLTTPAAAAAVRADLEEAKARSFPGTPAIIVGGKLLPGPPNEHGLQKALDGKL